MLYKFTDFQFLLSAVDEGGAVSNLEKETRSAKKSQVSAD